MDEDLKRDVLGLPPGNEATVKTFGEAIGEPSRKIPDPYGGTREDYEICADLLQEMIDRWLEINYPTQIGDI